MRSSATNNAGSSILEETTHSDLEVADFAISDSSSELFEDLNLAAQLRFNNDDEEENVKIRSGSVRTNQCGRLGMFPKKKSHVGWDGCSNVRRYTVHGANNNNNKVY